ncbi:glycoside hydrolase family 78 protein [Lachnospiraceae bacterium ASD3451]|uniref:family 78 glycoside hydrolase catalytic domain n=1 Tax=Diplocloster agilis TaxID=2850323 RepID=UPI001D37F85E|nr:family 78 glycoside hydrolase catalytic domain [Diplocloster agilis]MBU9747143.1 glycoside hydrolase family 78 protein [Diplocloster agilis]
MKEYEIYSLRCLDRMNPKGIDQTPCFSWKLKSTQKDTYQKYYSIKVWRENEILWDSGNVESPCTDHILYTGPALQSGTTYQWQLTSVDSHGHRAVSEKAEITTGILEKSFWKAAWVQPVRERKPVRDVTDSGAILSGAVHSLEYPEAILDAPVYMRKEFVADKKVKKAILYMTALGIYVCEIDGHKFSNLLAPEYTAYAKHVEYQTYNITKLLEKIGPHAIGIILADGWYTGKIGLMGIGEQYGKKNAVIFQMEIQYEDGTAETICSDETVKWHTGGYVYADLFVGEYLREEGVPQKFSAPGFDDAGWEYVEKKEYGYETLCAQSIDPICCVKEIKPKLLYTPKGEAVLDAGENICGFTKFATYTEPGVEIGMEHSEILDQDGNFMQNIMGQNKNQKDRIVPAGAWTLYEPRFTFHGFRYVKITGLKEVKAEDFTICVLTSRQDKTGSFRCSDERLNQLQDNIYRSQQGNMVCIPTDCPQRERAGWTGDMGVYAPTAVFNMDMQSFLCRWLSDMRIEQHVDGQIPQVVPDIDSNKYVGGNTGDPHISSAGWGDACVLVPYAIYRAYGNTDILKENYQMMKAWMDYVEAKAGVDLLGWGKLFHFGDWLIPSIVASTHKPIETALRTKEEMALGYMVYVADCMKKIAELLGKTKDSLHYRMLCQRGKDVFCREYVTEDGCMRQSLQGLYVMALSQNMLTEKQRQGAVKRLADLIHENGDSLDTGFLSVPFLLDVLCENGEAKTAYRVLFQQKRPGWFYALQFGATTIWENWAAILPEGTRTNSSYNHFAFGCVGDFIYRRIGGLQMEEAGYKKVRINPDYSCGLKWAKTEYDSVQGRISVHWKKEEDTIYLEVLLPPNVTGIVHVKEKQIEIGNGRYSWTIEQQI